MASFPSGRRNLEQSSSAILQSPMISSLATKLGTFSESLEPPGGAWMIFSDKELSSESSSSSSSSSSSGAPFSFFDGVLFSRGVLASFLVFHFDVFNEPTGRTAKLSVILFRRRDFKL